MRLLSPLPSSDSQRSSEFCSVEEPKDPTQQCAERGQFIEEGLLLWCSPASWDPYRKGASGLWRGDLGEGVLRLVTGSDARQADRGPLDGPGCAASQTSGGAIPLVQFSLLLPFPCTMLS